MIIQIELIVIALIAFIFLVWSIWFRWSRRRLRKKQNKQNPDNEKYKTREGGTERGDSEVGGAEPSLADTERSSPGPEQSAGRGLLPSAIDDIPGKNRHRLGNPLVRRARRRK